MWQVHLTSPSANQRAMQGTPFVAALPVIRSRCSLVASTRSFRPVRGKVNSYNERNPLPTCFPSVFISFRLLTRAWHKSKLASRVYFTPLTLNSLMPAANSHAVHARISSRQIGPLLFHPSPVRQSSSIMPLIKHPLCHFVTSSYPNT